MITQDNITLPQRFAARPPKFFRTLRTIGLALTGVAAAIIAAPVALPAMVVTVAGYIATAGTIAAVVSSTTVDFKALNATESER